MNPQYSESESRELIRELAEYLPPEEKQSVERAVRQLPNPSDKSVDKIWLLLVGAFVVVFVGSFAVITYDLNHGEKGIDDKLVTIFTTVTAFLAGLTAPSPIRGTEKQN